MGYVDGVFRAGSALATSRVSSKTIVALRVVALGLAVAAVTLFASAGWAGPAKPAEPELPPAEARLWVVAPSAQGQWLLRIDNEGEEPLRIPADVRLLRLEIWPAQNRSWARRAELCDGPASFGLRDSFPVERELLLEPGQSWVEQFDPRLICFGKQASLLRGGALVRARFGWPEPPRWSRSRERGLVAVDATQVPRRYAPRRELVAPTMLLSHLPPDRWASTIDAKPFPPPKSKQRGEGSAKAGEPGSSDATSGSSEAPAPASESSAAKGATARASQAAGSSSLRGSGPLDPPSASPDPGAVSPAGAGAAGGSSKPSDELGSRLALTTSRFADALEPRDVVVGVRVHNAGERAGRVALRSRQISFRVQGPDGVIECPRRTLSHIVPPDLFGRLAEGGHMQINVVLAEICPRNAFRRPGFYVAMPTIHAVEVDREKRIGAITGEVSTRDPGPVRTATGADEDATLVRIRRGIDSLHVHKPAVVPTATLHGRVGDEVADSGDVAAELADEG